ncbi:hypothetical protein BDV41DRAFT_520995 [Aspergillus transmontanensis]|uniref:Uncharacterized protein n=1 Tax=Aspergillus transmontanensis TaxID=1034304 RepID=A0A5N6WE08_9EURO|nr:hypothetical protein BDV41DRAFT_520995 [Aspergillus transmontanensis]
MLVRHFSAIRGMLYPSFSSGGGGDGRIRFRSFWLGWCFFFSFLGEWLMLDWEEWCVSLANLLGAGSFLVPLPFL